MRRLVLTAWIGLCPVVSWAACSGSSPVRTAADASRTEVLDCVTAAASGDTIIVPSGTATWSTPITLPASKDLTLSGATVVTCSGVEGSPSYVCSATNNTVLTCPGGCFNFDMGANHTITGFTMTNAATQQIMTCVGNAADGKRFRIHHNRLVSTGGWNPILCKGGNNGIHPSGIWDHNIIEGGVAIHTNGSLFMLSESNAQHQIWAEETPLGDSTRIIYVEANYFIVPSGSIQNFTDGNYGGRVVIRFNRTQGAAVVAFEFHSAQGSNRAFQRWEVYNNSVVDLDAADTCFHGIGFVRGGTGVFFNNSLSGSIAGCNFDMILDNVRSGWTIPTTVGGVRECSGSASSPWDQNSGGGDGWRCRDQLGIGRDLSLWNHTTTPPWNQEIKPAYFFGNTRGGGAMNETVSGVERNPTHIQWNRDAYKSNGASCSGSSCSSGVGSGPIASRPANCTAGTAWWATDEGEWNDLQPGPDGRLYKCVATNTWALYYTPYSYPHPWTGYVSGPGKSLRMTSGSGTWPQGAYSASQPYRVEFWMHDVGSGPGNFYSVIETGGVSFKIQWNGGSNMWLGPTHRTIGTPCTIIPANYPNGFGVRYQYDPSQGTYGREICEVYDIATGSRTVYTQFYTGTLVNSSTTGSVHGQTNGEVSIAFLRGYSTLVDEGTRIPVPADPIGDLFDFKFNNSLANGSGTAMTLTSPVYVASPPVRVSAGFKAGPAATWTDSVPCRAGHPCTLTSTSYSTSETSAVPSSLFWQQVSGATTVRFSSRTASAVSVTGCVFGPYTFRLVATDGSLTDTADMEVGCVSTDSKGVVVNGDSRLDTFFGPMIALGRNPWTWADERHLTGATLRNAAYETPGFASWQTGTVSWNRNGICNTTLTSAISAADTTLNVADASGCDWSSFPVYLQVGGYFGEIVSICSRAGNVLTVCTYGRGMNLTNNAYASGAAVAQYKVTGTGTSFLTALCPAGAGPPGTIYESGTVTLTNGSAAITRVSGGTTWVPGGEPTSRTLRITDGSNVFVASISSVSSGTTATMSRAWPGTSANYTYHILRSDRTFMALEWNDPDLPDNPPAPNGNTMPWTLAGCVSDTVAYVKDRYEAFGTGAVSGERYAWHKDVWLNGGGFGPNYYDEVLANYALYYRSGLSVGLTAARKLGRYWLKNPELMGGRVGGPPRTFSLAGATLAAVADGQSEDWPILRKMGAKDRDTTPCNSDLRETAYDDGALALKALFDPDSAQRANWKVELGKMYTRDNSCKGADHSYPTSYVIDGNFVSGAGPDLTATNGSRDVTGSGIPSTLCGTAATGSNGSVANGSTALTGSGFVSGSYIAVAGTRGGSPWIQFEQMTFNSGTSITLGQPWQGDTCSSNCRWYIFLSGVQYFVVGGLWDRTKYNWPTVDPLLADTIQNNACEWINSGLIRLALPFSGDTRSTYRWGMYNLMGNGTQVYMAGIKAYAQNYASKIDDGTLAANFTSLVRNTASWILNTGTFDPNDGVRRNGIYYARGFDDCEPAVIGSWHPYFCQPDANLNGEVMVAARNAYEADSGLLDKIDRLYGSTFGKPGWTSGVYQSPVDLTFPTNGDFAYKYYGLYFGMGFAHQWPAARLGGVDAAVMSTYSLRLEKPSWADNMRIRVMQPSGAEVSGVCTIVDCSVSSSVDLRQGVHEVTVEYRNSSNVVLRVAKLQATFN